MWPRKPGMCPCWGGSRHNTEVRVKGLALGKGQRVQVRWGVGQGSGGRGRAVVLKAEAIPQQLCDVKEPSWRGRPRDRGPQRGRGAHREVRGQRGLPGILLSSNR